METSFAKRVKDLGGSSFKFAPLHAGNPDRVVLMPGGYIYLVELKADNGHLDPAQRLWHRRAEDLGITVLVVTGSAEARSWIPPHGVQSV